MVAWLSAFAPGWMVVMRKPHKYGNEYHTICCCLCRIMFHMEIVEGKDKPTEGPHSTSQYSDLGKTAGLVRRMTKSIHGSGRVVILDSGFGFLPVVSALKATGLFATAVIKKRRYWPKGVPGAAILGHMQGKTVGTQQVYKGADASPCSGLWLGCMADSKHTSVMCNTWATTNETGRVKRRRVGTGLVEFKYAEYQHVYYKGRNAVDAHNQVRQGVLSLEGISGLKSWAARQFMFMLAVVETNALLGYNYFVHEPAGHDKLPKAVFRLRLAKRLVRNPELAGDAADAAAAGAAAADVAADGSYVHTLKKVPKGRGRFRDGRFPTISTAYAKWPCTFCENLVRTYCACDRTTIVCSICFHKHMT